MTKTDLSKHLLGLAALGILATAAACGRDDVAHYRVPKEPAAPAAAGQMGPTPAGAVPPPPDVSTTGSLQWTLPKGWTESRTGGMRYATLKPTAAGKIDVSVTVFPGTAGGELANVNRWRNQIGLAPIDDAALAKARAPVATKAGPISLYDFTSEGQTRSRVVAGLATVEGSTWFIKMTGDAAAVAAARPDFIRLVESLRLDAAN
jgi:hypothetical protein